MHVVLAFFSNWRHAKKSALRKGINPFKDTDTTIVFYRGNDTLTFLVTDTLDNVTDTLTFLGKGVKFHIAHGWTSFGNCTISHKNQNMDAVYQNRKDSLMQLTFNLNCFENYTEFTIRIKEGLYREYSYEGLTLDFFNPGLGPFHDSIKSLNRNFYHVVELTTPIGERGANYNIYNSAFFGKYDGIITLEAQPNRT